MGNDSCSFRTDWPRAKKSKTSEPEDEITQNWAYLPSVVLHEIFLLLNQRNRINASSVCRNWRHNLFHPHFWQEATFSIYPANIIRSRHKSSMIGHVVQNAIVKFDSMSVQCATEFLTLLKYLSTNRNLRSLLIEPTHCRIQRPHFEIFDIKYVEGRSNTLVKLVQSCCQTPLHRFSIGCNEDLYHHIPKFLESLINSRPDNVSLLGLASVKDDSSNYAICDIDPAAIIPFRNLRVLSIDYDSVSDVFINSLENTKLTRLVIHVHGVYPLHPGTTEGMWNKFKAVHPKCQLRMSFIHAYDEVKFMHDSILRENMPLSHLKVFFCEYINIEVLNILSTWYAKTLHSIVWVDSQCHDDQSATWNLVRRIGTLEENQPDPFVMAAWLCANLEEIVILGYKYFEEDLVAIARLRSDTLKVLEVASEDVIYSNEVYRGLGDSQEEISSIIGKLWAPLKPSELHPVICDSEKGDSDEYLLPLVIADLY